MEINHLLIYLLIHIITITTNLFILLFVEVKFNFTSIFITPKKIIILLLLSPILLPILIIQLIDIIKYEKLGGNDE